MPPWPHDLRGGRHPLHRLIEVLVERETGVRGEDDVVRLGDLVHRHLPRDVAGPLVHREQLAGEDVGHLLGTVEQYVARKAPGERGRLLRGCCRGPGCRRSAPGRGGVADPPAVVQVHHRLEPRQPRRHHLGAAGEAREEVRLDEPRGDADVGLHPLGVDPDRDAVIRPAEVGQRRVVARVVVDDPAVLDHFIAEHRPQLGVGVPAVRAGGDEDCDVLRCEDAVELSSRARSISSRGWARVPSQTETASRWPGRRGRAMARTRLVPAGRRATPRAGRPTPRDSAARRRRYARPAALRRDHRDHRQGGPASDGAQSAIHDHRGAVHEPTAVVHQEGDALGDLFRAAHPAVQLAR